MPNCGFHHHVEDRGGQRSTLGYTTVSLEGGGEVYVSHRYHPQPIPVRPQDPEHPGSHTASHQDAEAPVPSQGIVRPMGIQGNGAKELLTHGFQLMEQIIPEGGFPRPTSHTEIMEAVMVFYHHVQPPVDDTSCGLTQDLH